MAAIETAATTDKGKPIAEAIVALFRERLVLLPAANRIDRIGLAARAIARRGAEAQLIADLAPEKLQALDNLLVVDPAIGQTRFQLVALFSRRPGGGEPCRID
ncbi:hypothetical protein H0Z56_35480 [Rhizobium leguminosarum]|nr:hypothetical protein [Rhizobium leguminosarum]